MNVMQYANYQLDNEKINFDNLVMFLDICRSFDFSFYKKIIYFLNKNGYYPVWNMPGHRNTHYFPTKLECEMWEDYLWQCSE